MGLLDRLERALEALIEGRLMGRFAGGIHPLEIARRLAREMQAARRISVRRVYVPNRFRVRLSPRDAAPLEPIEAEVTREIEEFLDEQARAREYFLPGALEVELCADPDVADGDLQVDARFAANTTMELSPLAVPRDPEPPPATAPAQHPVETARALLSGRSGFLRGRVVHLEADLIRIGRTDDNDLHLPDPQVSRDHALLEWTGVTYRVRDLESRNGTKVNGRRLEAPHDLASGDVIELGSTTLVYGAL